MNKKLRYTIGIITVFFVIIISILTVNLVETKDDDAVKGDLVIWTDDKTHEYMKKSAEDFMELNVKADIRVIQVSEQDIEKAIAEHNMPDMVQLSSLKMRELNNRYGNIFNDISESDISSFSKNYKKARLNEASINGDLYGFPFTSRPLVLYLREDMLESYGYSCSEVNTWEDLINIGKDINEKSGGKVKVLNAVGQDYEDLKSLLIMQGMEELDNEEDIKNHLESSLLNLSQNNILNSNAKGEFLARISSNNAMYELSKIDEECRWIACNVPSQYNGSNKFYIAEGDNLVVLKDYEKNSKLIKKFMDYLSNDNDRKESYIINGDFFSSFLSVYNDKEIESSVKNFINISPVVIMDNVYYKAPSISDYDLYFSIKMNN